MNFHEESFFVSTLWWSFTFQVWIFIEFFESRYVWNYFLNREISSDDFLSPLVPDVYSCKDTFCFVSQIKNTNLSSTFLVSYYPVFLLIFHFKKPHLTVNLIFIHNQNALSLIGPALWNKVPEEIKRTRNLNAFKHNLKKHYLKELGKANF